MPNMIKTDTTLKKTNERNGEMNKTEMKHFE